MERYVGHYDFLRRQCLRLTGLLSPTMILPVTRTPQTLYGKTSRAGSMCRGHDYLTMSCSWVTTGTWPLRRCGRNLTVQAMRYATASCALRSCRLGTLSTYRNGFGMSMVVPMGLSCTPILPPIAAVLWQIHVLLLRGLFPFLSTNLSSFRMTPRVATYQELVCFVQRGSTTTTRTICTRLMQFRRNATVLVFPLSSYLLALVLRTSRLQRHWGATSELMKRRTLRCLRSGKLRSRSLKASLSIVWCRSVTTTS